MRTGNWFLHLFLEFCTTNLIQSTFYSWVKSEVSNPLISVSAALVITLLRYYSLRPQTWSIREEKAQLSVILKEIIDKAGGKET